MVKKVSITYIDENYASPHVIFPHDNTLHTHRGSLEHRLPRSRNMQDGNPRNGILPLQTLEVLLIPLVIPQRSVDEDVVPLLHGGLGDDFANVAGLLVGEVSGLDGGEFGVEVVLGEMGSDFVGIDDDVGFPRK